VHEGRWKTWALNARLPPPLSLSLAFSLSLLSLLEIASDAQLLFSGSGIRNEPNVQPGTKILIDRSISQALKIYV